MKARVKTRSPAVRRRAGRIARAAAPPDFSAREQLIDAASRLMSDRHSIEVSLSEIAAHSGLNSALVKYYFGNKDGLLLALVEREAAAALRDVRLLLELDLSPTQKLRKHIAAIINSFFRRPYLNRLLHSLLDERTPQTKKSAAHVRRIFVKPLLELQSELLEQGVKAGEFKPIDPVLFYVSMLGACDHLFNARYVLRGVKGALLNESLRARYVEHVCDVFINGVARPDARAPALPAGRRAARLLI
jgi:AcrR family transcriptional regulator